MTRVTSRDALGELADSTGGLIRFVDRSRARRADLDEVSSTGPAADGPRASWNIGRRTRGRRPRNSGP